MGEAFLWGGRAEMVGGRAKAKPRRILAATAPA